VLYKYSISSQTSQVSIAFLITLYLNTLPNLLNFVNKAPADMHVTQVMLLSKQ